MYVAILNPIIVSLLQEAQYILDHKGTLLHRVSLCKGIAFKETCKHYVKYVNNHYGTTINCCVDVVHQKLASIYVDAAVQVPDSVVFKEKREDHF